MKTIPRSISMGLTLAAALFVLTVAGADQALAQHAEPYQMNFQEAATPLMEQIRGFHTFLLWIITAITVFVTLVLIYTMVRYSSAFNKTPAKFSHNSLIEVVWTVIPIAILVAIFVPSMRTLFMAEQIPESDMTVKVTGLTWNWKYQYTDTNDAGEAVYDFDYISTYIPDEEIKGDQIRLLSTDAPLVVPAGKVVRVEVTADPGGVIHAFAVPAFGIKVDAVPGRLNETWFKVDKPGTYYGQCSELCGVGHYRMPIEVKVVPQAEYDAWLQQQVAAAEGKPINLASKLPAESN